MGSPNVQQAILDAVARLGGEVTLAQLIADLQQHGTEDEDQIVSSLLPLIYDSEIEFTPERRLRLQAVAA
jgi:hypothetical protein